ncbi:MAG: sugar isomerase domain-containing protein [Kiritimatiellia bacterium]|nr:sugar isomerase domain-containing protein [Kiritimatiellia bacterium]
MNVPLLYLDAVRRILDHFQSSQMEAVEQAADRVVACLRRRGTVTCAAIGHGNEQDFLQRAGGLVALRSWAKTFPLQPTEEKGADADLEAIRRQVRGSDLKKGDVMLIGSVSGRNRAPVELALQCREMGVGVIAFTALTYSRRVTSAHPSGKRLFETADVVLDNGAPYGDAAVSVPGIAESMLPVSGVAMTVAGWLIWGRVMERMAAEGDAPSVYISVNRPDGPDWKARALRQFEQRGY